MTDTEFRQLEILLGKLQMELGDRYSIAPNYLFDGCHIATFDESGLLKKSVIAATLKGAVEKVLEQ